MSIQDDNRDTGYDKEEEYFFKKNKELLAAGRERLDAARRQQELQQLKEQHWMRCPKCGQEMKEEQFRGIAMERCTGCDGRFFDAAELELLLSTKEPSGFLSGLLRRGNG